MISNKHNATLPVETANMLATGNLLPRVRCTCTVLRTEVQARIASTQKHSVHRHFAATRSKEPIKCPIQCSETKTRVIAGHQLIGLINPAPDIQAALSTAQSSNDDGSVTCAKTLTAE